MPRTLYQVSEGKHFILPSMPSHPALLLILANNLFFVSQHNNAAAHPHDRSNHHCQIRNRASSK